MLNRVIEWLPVVKTRVRPLQPRSALALYFTLQDGMTWVFGKKPRSVTLTFR
jgi:hypothetical protein